MRLAYLHANGSPLSRSNKKNKKAIKMFNVNPNAYPHEGGAGNVRSSKAGEGAGGGRCQAVELMEVSPPLPLFDPSHKIAVQQILALRVFVECEQPRNCRFPFHRHPQ
jgi:hypothetical protein